MTCTNDKGLCAMKTECIARRSEHHSCRYLAGSDAWAGQQCQPCQSAVLQAAGCMLAVQHVPSVHGVGG